MGNLHLVTGYAGQAHVTAADMASLFEALVRRGEFVMAAGANFGAAIISNNQIRVSDGELMMQGRHVKLDPGTYVDMVIENGDQGLLRHDLIVARYSHDVETGIEDCSLAVIKGTSTERDPADPKYTTGRINAEGAVVHEMPLYRVVLSGLNVEKLQPLFEPQVALFESLLSKAGGTMTGAIHMDGNRITGLGAPVNENDAVPKSYVTPEQIGAATAAFAQRLTVKGELTEPYMFSGSLNDGGYRQVDNLVFVNLIITLDDNWYTAKVPLPEWTYQVLSATTIEGTVIPAYTGVLNGTDGYIVVPIYSPGTQVCITGFYYAR